MNNLNLFYELVRERLFDENYDLGKVYIMTLLPNEYIKKYKYDFDIIYNNIKKLDNSISEGTVYEVSDEGSILRDGYEKSYLFLSADSSIKKHYHYTEKEHYKCIFGDNNAISSNFCNIGLSHEIKSVYKDTFIRTYKYIPGAVRK